MPLSDLYIFFSQPLQCSLKLNLYICSFFIIRRKWHTPAWIIIIIIIIIIKKKKKLTPPDRCCYGLKKRVDKFTGGNNIKRDQIKIHLSCLRNPMRHRWPKPGKLC